MEFFDSGRNARGGSLRALRPNKEVGYVNFHDRES